MILKSLQLYFSPPRSVHFISATLNATFPRGNGLKPIGVGYPQSDFIERSRNAQNLTNSCLVLSKSILVLFACFLPFSASSATEDDIVAKRTNAVMRMIGHEVLMSAGDCESRILPIEQIEKRNKISFENDFALDPATLVRIINGVMTQTRFASNYFVEVEQCESKQIVHSYEMSGTTDPSQVPCSGRLLPRDCYNLLITLMDEDKVFGMSSLNAIGTASTTSNDKSIGSSTAPEKAFPFLLSFLWVPLMVLMGFGAFYFRPKKVVETDPNLILIGASWFDKKNRALSFENNNVELSHKEAELLTLLHSSANEPVAREVILQKVWGDEGDYVGRTLDVFVSKLRKKLEADEGVRIENVRGVGYRLVVG
jgi:Transcriptional regulatory protein, C terminal